jgi:hypothetical protein
MGRLRRRETVTFPAGMAASDSGARRVRDSPEASRWRRANVRRGIVIGEGRRESLAGSLPSLGRAAVARAVMEDITRMLTKAGCIAPVYSSALALPFVVLYGV